MFFGTRHKVKKARNVKVSIANTYLQVVPTYKYLGFTLDSTLTFGNHVSNVTRLVAYKANLLAKIRKFLTEKTALNIYKSMIMPYFDYGDVVYDTACQDGLEKLQRLQNRCLKICKCFNMRHGTKDLHVTTKMPMLADRRSCHINNFMYGQQTKEYLLDTRNINTRAHDAPLFRIKIPKNETYKRSVEYAGSMRWNALPPEVRGIANQIELKKQAEENTVSLYSQIA